MILKFKNLDKIMSKNLKVLGIGVLLIGLAVTGWFLVTGQSQKTADKTQNNNMESQDTKQSVKSEEQKRVEKLKKEKDLVWYEIPEMNIKFLVTKDTKEDLRYRHKEYKGYREESSYLNIKDIMLYSSSETDANLTGCTVSENIGWSCGWIQLNTVSKREVKAYIANNGLNFDWCSNSNFKKFKTDNYFGCIIRVQDYIILNDEYQNFFHIPITQKNKIFGIYFNTIQSNNR